jgi:hypothetical protein
MQQQVCFDHVQAIKDSLFLCGELEMHACLCMGVQQIDSQAHAELPRPPAPTNNVIATSSTPGSARICTAPTSTLRQAGTTSTQLQHHQDLHRHWTTTSSPICTNMKNYVKLYDYIKLFAEFYIANTKQRQGLHHASRRRKPSKTKPCRLSPPLRCESPLHAANDNQEPAAAAETLPPPKNPPALC